MAAPRIYISTTIPYVNARPHLGFALELVQADVLARHYRRRGAAVRLQSGTDDNSLKNVLAARAAGCSTQELVDRNAAAFAELRGPLSLSLDDFIRTGSDPRHRPGVERLWQACAASGDLYRRRYEGLYCVGCEQFYLQAELPGGRCAEHRTWPELVAEENWFFRLSRYAGALQELISSGRLRIEPAGRRNEVLGFIAGGLADFSVSRSAARAGGWGIPVPGDPGQVIYVWWDALGNYISAIGYGGCGTDYQQWWHDSERRIHLAGKGVLRFHAVYWPAILLSAGQPPPTDILVHDYLTIGGQKISKSGPADGGADGLSADPDRLSADPAELVRRCGTDAVRWWLLREVPRVGDADFSPARLIDRANADLANGLGNLVSRVVSLVHRHRDGVVPAGGSPTPPAFGGDRLAGACERVPGRVADALADFDFRAATGAIWEVVDEANRYAERAAPWHLARRARAGGDGAAGERGSGERGGGDREGGERGSGDREGGERGSGDRGGGDRGGGDREGDDRAAAAAQLDTVLALLAAACRVVASELAPFLPGLAARTALALDDGSGRLPAPAPLYPRIGPPRGVLAAPPPTTSAPPGAGRELSPSVLPSSIEA